MVAWKLSNVLTREKQNKTKQKKGGGWGKNPSYLKENFETALNIK